MRSPFGGAITCRTRQSSPLVLPLGDISMESMLIWREESGNFACTQAKRGARSEADPQLLSRCRVLHERPGLRASLIRQGQSRETARPMLTINVPPAAVGLCP